MATRWTCPDCGTALVGVEREPGSSAWDRPLRAQLVLHCPTHGKPAYNDPTSKAYQRRLSSDANVSNLDEILRIRGLIVLGFLTVLALVALGELPDVAGATLGPPLAVGGALLVAWLQHRHVHRFRAPGQKVPPLHRWACRWATAHAGATAAWIVGGAALTSFVATRSLVAALVTAAVYAAALAVTWRPGGALRTWARANREPSVLETR